MPSARRWQRLNHESRISVSGNSRCTRNTAHNRLPTQKNTKLYGRHRKPYNLVFIWCFNLQNGQLQKVTIHIFEWHKTPQYRTFQHFRLRYGGDKLLLEKENIYTLDSKGELLITIMSSIAQEESRSISENVTWGQRKRFADGKVSLPYKQFLGYRRGEDGRPEVVEEEAKIVRLIYRLYLEGWASNKIANHLTDKGIPTPGKKKVWQSTTVDSILTNEKYKGDALLQKTYTVDFLSKRRKENDGEIPQYYVEGSHEQIVSPEAFDLVQYEYERRKRFGKQYSANGIFSTRIFCGQCGGIYGSKVWHSNSQYRAIMYRCNNKYREKNRSGKECTTPALRESEIKEAFLGAFNSCITNRAEIIKNCRLAIDTVIDTTKLEADVSRLTEECTVVAEMIRKCVDENAHISVDPQIYAVKYESLANRYTTAKEQLDVATEEISKRTIRKGQIEDFLKTIKKNDRLLTEFDETLWCTVIEKVTVFSKENIVFEFKGGTEVKWSL